MNIQIKPEGLVEKAYPWTTDTWITSVAHNPSKMYAVIHDLGIRDPEVTTDLYEAMHSVVIEYPENFAPFDEYAPIRSKGFWGMESAIRDWFAGIKVIEEDTTLVTKQVPLFLFNSPPFPGAKVTYGETQVNTKSLGWKIEVLGTGFGADVTVAITHTTEFISSAGNQKLIFAPLNVRLVKAALYKQGIFQGNFLKASLAEPKEREANGIRSLSTAEWKELALSHQPIDRFDLSGDKSSDVAKYQRIYKLSGSFESKLGLKAFNLETNITAKCSAEHSAEATFELPPGRIYRLWAPSSMSGFFFNA